MASSHHRATEARLIGAARFMLASPGSLKALSRHSSVVGSVRRHRLSAVSGFASVVSEFMRKRTDLPSCVVSFVVVVVEEISADF